MRYHIWYEPTARDDVVRVRCVAADGTRQHDAEVNVSAATKAAEGLQLELEARSRDASVKFHGLNVPAHVTQLWTTTDQPAELSPAELRRHVQILRDETHLCASCIMMGACAVGEAAERAERILPIINACLGYQPDESEST